MFARSNDNYNIYYESIGYGPAILLLHGFGNNHEIWQETGWIELLKAKYTVILIDFRGCGKSDKPIEKKAYSLENHLNDINLILETIGYKEPIIWGWSLGATLAMHYAANYRVKSIIACGSYFGLIFSNEYTDRMLKQSDSEINNARINAFRNWPIVFPRELKDRFLLYTGTKDGNVFVRLTEQKEDIEYANGKVVFLDEVDHIGLLNEIEKVRPIVEEFLNMSK